MQTVISFYNFTSQINNTFDLFIERDFDVKKQLDNRPILATDYVIVCERFRSKSYSIDLHN